MTTVRLAIGGGTGILRRALSREGVAPPALLTSYHYLRTWLAIEQDCTFRDWALDSGAFSAHSLGVTIELQAYIEAARELQASDPKLTEVFSLDVIGCSDGSRKNAERMRDAGLQVIPCYHVGEPKELLRYYCREWPKVALGGAVGYRKKLEWARLCFREVWPHKLHGFGFGTEEQILALPWHSVDASSWEIGATKFGTWYSYGRAAGRGQMKVRGTLHDLSCEVEHYLRLEARAVARHAKRYRELEAAT